MLIRDTVLEREEEGIMRFLSAKSGRAAELAVP